MAQDWGRERRNWEARRRSIQPRKRRGAAHLQPRKNTLGHMTGGRQMRFRWRMAATLLSPKEEQKLSSWGGGLFGLPASSGSLHQKWLQPQGCLGGRPPQPPTASTFAVSRDVTAKARPSRTAARRPLPVSVRGFLGDRRAAKGTAPQGNKADGPGALTGPRPSEVMHKNQIRQIREDGTFILLPFTIHR